MLRPMESDVSSHCTQFGYAIGRESQCRPSRPGRRRPLKAQAYPPGDFPRFGISCLPVTFCHPPNLQASGSNINLTHTCGLRASSYVGGNKSAFLNDFTNQTSQNEFKYHDAINRAGSANLGSHGFDYNSVVPNRDTQESG
jgi:hypothetical protein